MVDWADNCILITGVPKSGTSLLMDLIDGHPNIIVYPQEPFFRDIFRRRYQNKIHLLIDAKIGTANLMHTPVKTLPAHNRSEPVQLTDTLIQNKLHLNELTGLLRGKNLTALFDFRKYHDTFNKITSDKLSSLKDLMGAMIVSTTEAISMDTSQLKLWAFKDPSFTEFDKFFSLYLDGKAIIIIRNPHARYLSVLKTQNKKHGSIFNLIKYTTEWKRITSRQLGIRNQFGDERVLITNYENIVTNTKQEMERISQFVNVEYNEILETPTRFGIPNIVSTASLDEKQIFKSSVTRWKTELYSWEKLLIDMITWNTLKEIGYSPYYDSIATKLGSQCLKYPLYLLAFLVNLPDYIRLLKKIGKG